MKTNYSWLKNVFMQSALSRFFLDKKLKALPPKNFLELGEIDYWVWRYVFMKDVTKKHITAILLNLGFDNLTVVELMNELNNTRIAVAHILEEAKKEAK